MGGVQIVEIIGHESGNDRRRGTSPQKDGDNGNLNVCEGGRRSREEELESMDEVEDGSKKS
jgi:hypothetical protein